MYTPDHLSLSMPSLVKLLSSCMSFPCYQENLLHSSHTLISSSWLASLRVHNGCHNRATWADCARPGITSCNELLICLWCQLNWWLLITSTSDQHYLQHTLVGNIDRSGKLTMQNKWYMYFKFLRLIHLPIIRIKSDFHHL